jgi:hypothetical protein
MKTKSEKTINFCLKIIGAISGILTIITFIQMKTELTIINWLFIIFLLTFIICGILIIRAKWIDSIDKITSDINTIKKNNNKDIIDLKDNIEAKINYEINDYKHGVFGERMNDFIKNNEIIKQIKKSNELNNIK